MLQVRGADDGRSEWNVGETHIIIPMYEGDVIANQSDRLLANTVALSALESGDAAVLTNPLEHSLVFGVDKNLFDSANVKSDLVIIQSPELKFVPYNSDLKVAYTLSNVDQEKSEILWENQVLKDRIYGGEKAVFEVRPLSDVDLEKTNAQINLGVINNGVITQTSRSEKEVLVEEHIAQIRDVADSQFLVNYIAEGDSSKPICIFLNAEASKRVENGKAKEASQSDVPQSRLDNEGPPYRLGEDFEESVFNVTSSMGSFSEPYGNDETEKKDKVMGRMSDSAKESEVEGEGGKWEEEGSDSFPEKNLPLKKKAKMKRTLGVVNWENANSVIRESSVVFQEEVQLPLRKKAKHVKVITSLQEKQGPSHSDVVPATEEVGAQEDVNVKCLHGRSLVSAVKNDVEKGEMLGGDEMPVARVKSFELEKKEFGSIFELVESLRMCRIINPSVWQVLNSGLKEMKVDILKEMKMKRKKSGSCEQLQYSPQLKAFALVLHFKQPAAFNHLSQVYQKGWPSLNVIKEWKRQMNNCPKWNFARGHSDAESKS